MFGGLCWLSWNMIIYWGDEILFVILLYYNSWYDSDTCDDAYNSEHCSNRWHHGNIAVYPNCNLLYSVFFLLVPPNFSTKKKTANQPIRAAVPVNPVTKKGCDWLLGSFLFGTEIGEYQWKKSPCISCIDKKDIFHIDDFLLMVTPGWALLLLPIVL